MPAWLRMLRHPTQPLQTLGQARGRQLEASSKPGLSEMAVSELGRRWMATGDSTKELWSSGWALQGTGPIQDDTKSCESAAANDMTAELESTSASTTPSLKPSNWNPACGSGGRLQDAENLEDFHRWLQNYNKLTSGE